MTYLITLAKGVRQGSAISPQNGYLVMETFQKSNNYLYETPLHILN